MIIFSTIAGYALAIIWFFATVRQTRRAERAEAALARVEAVIKSEATLVGANDNARAVPNALEVYGYDEATGVFATNIAAVYVDGVKVEHCHGYNIAEGWVDALGDKLGETKRLTGVVSVEVR